MRYCRCSTRALELFVRDVAALDIRVSPQQIRHFSARPARRQIDVTRPTDKDAYVPFETQKAVREVAYHPRDQTSKEHGRAALNIGEDPRESEEWHAELEMVPQTDGQSEHSATVPAASDVGTLREKSVLPGSDTAVDFVALPNLELPAKTGRLAASIPEIYNITPAPAPHDETTRQENRRLRKSRRKEEGAFRPQRREAKLAKAMPGAGKGTQEEELDQLIPMVRNMEPTLVTDTPLATKSECTTRSRKTEAKAVSERAQESSMGEAEKVEDQLSSVLRNIEDMEGTGSLLPPKWTKPRKPRSETGRNAPKPKESQEAKPGRPLPQIKRERWQIQKDALLDKHEQQAWNPRKRLSPDTLDGIRALHASNPAAYSTETLSEHFKVTPENIRRILKSKWRPNEEEVEDRRERWEKRGVKKWSAMAEQGVRPPKQWREMGVGSVKGSPEDRPSWKKGGRRNRDEGGVGGSWDQMMERSQQKELGIAERFV